MQYNLPATEKVEQLLLKTGGYFYEHGDKAGRLLAQQLKGRSVAQQIPEIKTTDGKLTIIPQETNDSFTWFYSNLYKSETSPDSTDMENLFNNMKTPLIDETHRSATELPLNQTEIIKAMKGMGNGKSPGPDGYPIEFFKKIADKLSKILLDMFNDSFTRGSLPQTLTEALIILLVKPGKESTEYSSYPPISLLNSDAKIPAKVLARWLETTVR